MAVGKREVQFGLLGLAGLLMVLVGVLAARYSGLIGERHPKSSRHPPEPLAAKSEPPATFDPTAPRPLSEMLTEPAAPLIETPTDAGLPPSVPGSPSDLGLAPPRPAGRLTSGATRRQRVHANGEPKRTAPSAAANNAAHDLAPGAPAIDEPQGWETTPAAGSAFPVQPDAAPLPSEGGSPDSEWSNPQSTPHESSGPSAPQDPDAAGWPPGPSERVAEAPRRRGRGASEPAEPFSPSQSEGDDQFAPAHAAPADSGEGWPPTVSTPPTPAPFDEPGADAGTASEWVEPERGPSSRRSPPTDPPPQEADTYSGAGAEAPVDDVPPDDAFSAEASPGEAPRYDDPRSTPGDEGPAAYAAEAAPRAASEPFADDAYTDPAVEQPPGTGTPTEFQPVEPQPAPLGSPPRVRGRNRVQLTGDEEAPPPRATEPAAPPIDEPIPPVAEAAESPGWAGLRYQVTPVDVPPTSGAGAGAETGSAENERGWSPPPSATRPSAETAGPHQGHPAAAPGPAGGGQEFVVGPQDTYWSIAQQVYGNGGYFKALYEYNRRAHPRPDRLRPGDRLVIPSREELERDFPELIPRQLSGNRAPAPGGGRRPPSPAPTPSGRTYVVQEGDTLFDIARYELGRAARWVEIYELNRTLIGEDMNRLKPGTELALPAAAAAGNLSRQPEDAWRR